MSSWRRWGVMLSLVGIVVVPTGVAVPEDQDGANSRAKDWTLFGVAWTNQRYTTLTQLTPEDVKTLGGAWNFPFQNNASTRAGAVVKDGIMYISAGTRLYAIDAATGKEVWSFRPTESAPSRLENANIGDLLNAR